MATGGAVKVVGKISECHLDCSICFNRFTEPKLLDCLHTFCLNCLQNLRQGQHPMGRILKCPMCRRETILGRNGVKDLPTSRTLSALVEEFTIQEQLLEGQGSEIKCPSCDAENPAISFCMECGHFMCRGCHNAHARKAVTKSHNTYTLDHLRSGEVAYKSPLREERKCGKHPDMNLIIYCKTCEQLICTTCSVLKHQKHSHAGISEAFKECKKEIANLLAKAEQKKTARCNKKEYIVMAYSELDFMFEATNKKISQKADKEVARIRETEQKLKKEAKEIYEDRVKTFEELKEAEQTLDGLNQLMAQEIKTEILDLKPKLLNILKEMMKNYSRKVPDTLYFIDFQERDEKSLGRLILKDEWKLEKKTHYRTDSLAIFSDEIVTVNKNKKELMSHVPTSNNKFPLFSQKLDAFGRDSGLDQLAVHQLDQLIALDGPLVKIFDRYGKALSLYRQFQPGLDSDSKPTCLAVDDNNLIAVGYQAKQEISLHKPDGSLLKRLSAPGISDQLAISNQHLIYISSTSEEGKDVSPKDSPKITALDYNGETVFQIISLFPKIVFCDRQGNIYVSHMTLVDCCDPLFRSYSPVYVFSPDGEQIDDFRIVHDYQEHQNETTMAFTHAGDLVIGTEKQLLIYQRV